MSVSRTAKFKAHDPTGHKLRCVRRAVEQYSSAYWTLLDQLRSCEEQLAKQGSKTGITSLIREVGDIDLEGALRAGMIEDAAFNLLSYFELQDATWPAPPPYREKETSKLLDELVGTPLPTQQETAIKNALKTEPKDALRPVYLSKYRHVPILRSDDGEKLWIAAKIPTQGKETYLPGSFIRDVTGLPKRNRTTSYVLFPIECGRWHMHRFFREGVPKSCRVQVDGDEVYFHYAFSFDPPSRKDPSTVLGIDRGRAVTGAWCVVDLDGSPIQEGDSMDADVRSHLKEIDRKIADTQKKGGEVGALWDARRRFVRHTLHHIANRIVHSADQHNALIAFEDLSNITGATGSSNLNRGLTRSQYGRLYDLVEYKAEERGLYVVEVAPQYTSQTCACGHTDPDSRVDRDTFRCVQCSRERHADRNAAHMVALRGVEYLSGGGYDTFSSFVRSLELA